MRQGEEGLDRFFVSPSAQGNTAKITSRFYFCSHVQASRAPFRARKPQRSSHARRYVNITAAAAGVSGAGSMWEHGQQKEEAAGARPTHVYILGSTAAAAPMRTEPGRTTPAATAAGSAYKAAQGTTELGSASPAGPSTTADASAGTPAGPAGSIGWTA